jgi:hypothetical protein
MFNREQGIQWRRRSLGLVVTALGVLLLTSCYLPDKFVSEIRLGNTGDYALTYHGDLIWAPLFRKIQRHEIQDADIATEIAALQRDLTRDPSFSKVQSEGDGRFAVDYHHEGHLDATGLFAFVRRNSVVLELHATPDGKITIDGNTIKPSQAVEATTLGLNVSGEFRVITSGHVLYHNATSVKTVGPYLLYIWTIENAFSPSPHLVMQRDGDWPKKP